MAVPSSADRVGSYTAGARAVAAASFESCCTIPPTWTCSTHGNQSCWCCYTHGNQSCWCCYTLEGAPRLVRPGLGRRVTQQEDLPRPAQHSFDVRATTAACTVSRRALLRGGGGGGGAGGNRSIDRTASACARPRAHARPWNPALEGDRADHLAAARRRPSASHSRHPAGGVLVPHNPNRHPQGDSRPRHPPCALTGSRAGA